MSSRKARSSWEKGVRTPSEPKSMWEEVGPNPKNDLFVAVFCRLILKVNRKDEVNQWLKWKKRKNQLKVSSQASQTQIAFYGWRN